MSRTVPTSPGPAPVIWLAVPVFDNRRTVGRVVSELLALDLPLVVVDDGSSDGSGEAAAALGVTVITHAENRGKGAAILTAAEHIRAAGGSHLICFDADGQFAAPDVARFVAAIAADPWAVVYGVRQFGADVPGSSLFGHRFSNFWARLITGTRVLDSQCGFRAYPVAALLDLDIKASRYDFEVDALVRSAWAGLDLVGVPIAVTYSPPEGRVTHFHPIRDNARISRSYAKLFFRAIAPVPHRMLVRDGAASGRVLSPWRPLELLRALLGEHSSPNRLAAAVALGLLLATLPLIACHSVAIIVAAGLLRLNRLLAFSVSHLCAPPFVPAVCLEVGYYLRHGAWLATFNAKTLWAQLDQRFLDYLLGTLVVAPVLAALGFAATLALATVASRLGRARGVGEPAPPGRDVTARYGSRGGIRFYHLIISLLGLRTGYAVLWLAVPYYWLVHRSIRVAITPYLRRRFPRSGRLGRFVHGYCLVHEFARTMVDDAALGVFGEDFFAYDVDRHDELKALLDDGRGTVLVTAHVGRWRSAIPTLGITRTPVHLLLFHTLTPVDAGDVAWGYGPARVIPPQGAFGGLLAATAALTRGDCVSIMGDRQWGGRTVAVEFLGDRAWLPESPYRLARSTGARLLVVLVSRVGYRRLRVEHYELDDRDARDARRPELVAELAQRFVDVLAAFLDRHPSLWFNFFDFWQAPERGASSSPTDT